MLLAKSAGNLLAKSATCRSSFNIGVEMLKIFKLKKKKTKFFNSKLSTKKSNCRGKVKKKLRNQKSSVKN